MNFKIAFEIVVTLLLLGTFALAFSIQPAGSSPKKITVPDDYPTIQQAIDAANPGDDIHVRAGHYNETIVIQKSLDLHGDGMDNTIIDGFQNMTIGTVVDIRDDVSNVNVSGFTIQNARTTPHWGIYMGWRTGKINIFENRVFANDKGIEASNCSNSTITSNIFTGNNIGVCMDSGCLNINVSDNIVKGLRPPSGGDGIQIWSSSVNVIHNNITHLSSGIALWSSDSNRISDNIIDQSVWICIRIQSCARNTFSNNFISGDSQRSDWLGFELLGNSREQISENNTFSNNIIENRQEGMRIHLPFEPSHISNNTVIGNTFRYCNIGVYARNMTSENYIYHNNFIDNKVQAIDEGENFWNKAYPCGGNYWSDYSGSDQKWDEKQDTLGDSDMIGDTPYTISGGKNDSYPLMQRAPMSPNLWTFENNSMGILTDSSITNFSFNQTSREVSFNTSHNISDIFRIIIPKSQMDGAFNLLIDGAPGACLIKWGRRFYMINFTCARGNHTIAIKAEYVIGTWCPDVNHDGIVDIRDIAIVAKQFRKQWPP
jgi:parallel beta-helix repeat protein